MPVSLNQEHFRVRTDATAAQGGTPVWAAAQDTNASIAIGANFRIRFCIANTGGTTGGKILTLQASRNSGAYAQVTTSTTFIQAVDATAGASANQSVITTQLLSGVGTFNGLGEYLSTATSTTETQNAGGCNENEFGLVITASSSVGDTFDFEVLQAASTMTYVVTPRITVASSASALVASRKLNVLLRR